MYTKFTNFAKLYFPCQLQHFATKLGNSTNFGMFFLNVPKDFVLLLTLKVGLTCTLPIYEQLNTL